MLAATAFGQGLTGSITGSVTDQSGAAVPGADLTLVNVETSQTRQAKSDTSGDFVFTQLLPGNYKLSVVGKGFKKYEQTGLILSSTERLVVKAITLDLGEVSQTVEVTAEAARLQTQSAERSGLISTEQTQNIPLKGRDYLGLLKMLPGVVDTQNRNAPGWNNLSQRQRQRRAHRHAEPHARRRLVARHGLDDRPLPRALDRRRRRDQGPALQLPGRIRPLLRRHHQHDHQERHQGLPRRRLLLPPQRGAQRQRVLPQPRQSAQAAVPLQLPRLLHRRPRHHRQVQQGPRQAVLLLVAGVPAAQVPDQPVSAAHSPPRTSARATSPTRATRTARSSPSGIRSTTARPSPAISFPPTASTRTARR